MAIIFEDNTAIDFVFHLNTEYTIQDIDKRLNKSNWFSKLNNKTNIQHTLFERVGKLIYISHDEVKEIVTVKKENGDIVSFDYFKINIL